MKTLLIGFGIIALSTAMTASAYACQGAHGYTKTAMMIEQSTLSTTRKAALMRVVTQSKADHDASTAQGDYAKMHDAVQQLATVKEQLGR